VALYLSRLKFKNIRGFKDLELSFEGSKKHRQWTIFVGDNGHGKTTILRAIALGLGDERTTSELLGQLPGYFIRVNKKGAHASDSWIQLTLEDSHTKTLTVITTKLKMDAHGGVTVEKHVSDPDFQWASVFVCGYGSNRGIGSRTHGEYALRNALLTLFNDRAGLLDPESILRDFALMSAQRKMETGDDPLKQVKAYLWKLWGLQQNHQLEVSAQQVVIHGPWGGMPFHALGDGYRGTGSWLLDLMGNCVKAGRWDSELSGIVLLDEMDEHLHPRWQKQLVPKLRRLLPKIQFIATTHSPLAIVNTEPGELYATRLHNAVAELDPNPLQPPDGRGANELLMGEWFGLESTLDIQSEKILNRYRKAFQDGDRARLKQLEPELHRRVRSFLAPDFEYEPKSESFGVQIVGSEIASLTEQAQLVAEAARERLHALKVQK
jgi:predicted ATP-binding protein involved in virulence